MEALGEFTLKGFHRPVPAYNVLALRQDVMDGADGAALATKVLGISTAAR